MIKLLTLVTFISAQLAMPLHSFAQGPVVNEFQKSSQELEQKVAREAAIKEKKDRVQAIKNEIRDKNIVLAARVNQLETLAESIPNVREDVIEDTAEALTLTDRKQKNNDLFNYSAVVAVASGLVYALTQYDVPKAVAQMRATQKVQATASTQKQAKAAPTPQPRVKSTVVNNGLRSVYGNKVVARTSAGVGILAVLVAGYALIDNRTWSLEERAAIRSLENNYLSQLVSGGQAQHLDDDQIEDALENYHKDAAFREAVLNEVRTIVAETEQLTSDINAKKQELATLTEI